MATTSVIALVAIALNLLLTFGLLLAAIYLCQRLIRHLTAWTEQALAQGGTYAHQAAETVDRASRTLVQPIIHAESTLEQAKSTLEHLDPRQND